MAPQKDNATSSNVVSLIGNAHLDPAWMWRMPEGLEAFSATCRSAIARIQEFPGFIFTCSSAAHYAFVEETDPKLFSEIQDAVKSGAWSIVGGWWVESDCNLPSGESFVRQALLGQRFFQSRYGKIATVGYNIDSFGHNANLPQLLSKAGLTSYVFMRPEQQEKVLSAALFNWEAPSGDRIVTYRLPLHYSDYIFSVSDKLRFLHFYDLFTPRAPWMIFYGVGNHGGGPTIEHIKEIIQLRSEGRKIEFSDPERFFANLQSKDLPVIRDEMQPHAIGCYSAHSEIKRLNRRAENILGQAERFSVLSKIIGSDKNSEANSSDFDLAWKNVCFNQFHDILGGVAIKEACDDAITMYRESISIADRSIRTNLQRLASRIDTTDSIENLIIFNSSTFEREEMIEFELWNPEASERGNILNSVVLIQSDGTRVPTQKIEPSGKIGDDRARFVAKVLVPALGWSRYSIERNSSLEIASLMFVSAGHISNGLISIDLSRAKAEMTSYRYERPIALDDKSDTWSHGLRAFNGESYELVKLSLETREKGPIRVSTNIHSDGGDSDLWETFLLSEGSEFIELRAGLDWRQKRSLLKFRFPHGCSDPVARYEIPYASIERPIGPNEWPGQSWIDVSEKDGSHGLSIATDSKYSYSVDGKYIYVIVARGALYAHHVPPHSSDVFGDTGSYLDQGWQEFRFLIIPHKGDWRKPNLPKLTEQFLQPLIVHTESAHDGDLPSTYSAFNFSGDDIRIGALKRAEDVGGIIVRAVEQRGEKSSGKFKIADAGWNAEFDPFEIKSFLIQDSKVTEVDLLERPL